MKRNFLTISLIAVLFIVIGAYVGAQRFKPTTPAASASSQLFAQSLPDPQGQLHSLAQWKGKVLIVNFWATWCTPCVQEMPELSALQAELGGKNVQVIGIGIDSSSNIIEFSSMHKITYPLYVAGTSGTELSRQLGNNAGGLPFTILIKPNGQILKTYLGRLKFEELRRDLVSI